MVVGMGLMTMMPTLAATAAASSAVTPPVRPAVNPGIRFNYYHPVQQSSGNNNACLNGHCPSGTEMMAIKQARAKFNTTGDSSALMPLLAHRRGVSNSVEQQQLDKLTMTLAKNLDVQTTTDIINKKTDAATLTTQPADAATRLVLASQIVSMLGHKPGLIGRMNYDKLKIIIAENNQLQGARGRSTANGELFINHDILWGDACPGDGHNTLVHELCHMMDGCQNRDGILSGMEMTDKLKFRMARRKLYGEYRQNYRARFGIDPEKDSSPPPKSDPWWEQDANGDGIRNYVFFGRDKSDLKEKREFVADTVRIFMEKPQTLKNSSAMLYNVYVNYFGFDPVARFNLGAGLAG